MEKATEGLEHELTNARGVEGFFDENAEELRHYSASEYLQVLLAEKGLKRADVIRAAGLHPHPLRKGRLRNGGRERLTAAGEGRARIPRPYRV